MFDASRLLSFLLNVARLAVWLALLVIVFTPLERLSALHRRAFSFRTFAQDAVYYFINALVPALLMAVPLSFAALAAHSLVPWRVQAAIAAMPLWQRVIAGLVVGEIGFYWGHRWMHEIPFLWRFHAIHHAPEHVYFLMSARAHPIDNAFQKLCGFIPIYVLGIASPLTPNGSVVPALMVIILTMWGFFIHANTRLRLGPLEWLVATPAFHHWHHTRTDHRDHNYAPTLPWIDRLFGTHYMPRGKWPAEYGTDTELPRSLAGQLVYPVAYTSHPVIPAQAGTQANPTGLAARGPHSG